MNGINRLDFEDQNIVDQDIHAVSDLSYLLPLVEDRAWMFHRNLKTSLAQLNLKASLVNTFEEARAQRAMNSIGAGDDLLG